MNGSDWQSPLRTVWLSLESWWGKVDPATFMISIVLFGLVIAFRKRLAHYVLGRILVRLGDSGRSIGAETRERLERALSGLLVVFALYGISEALALPEVAGGFIRNVLFTFAIVSIFTAWYELAEPFVSLLRSSEMREVKLETGWITRVTKFAILLFGLTALLKVWSIDISGALTGVGVLGAGLAIAAQDLVRNLIAGMTNQSEKRFVTGDAIEIEGVVSGIVEQIDLRSTLVRGFDEVPRHVPNSELSNSIIMNYSRIKHRRVQTIVPLVLTSSEAQIEAVRKGIIDYIRDCGDFRLQRGSPNYVHVTPLGDSSVDIMIYVLTKSGAYADYLAVMDRLSLKVLEIVAEAGTELAYPTQSIQLVQRPVPEVP